MTEYIGDTFEVETVNGTKEFITASRISFVHNKNSPSFLTVHGDEDYGEDTEYKLRTFNLEYVVDYGWV